MLSYTQFYYLVINLEHQKTLIEPKTRATLETETKLVI